MDRKGRNVSEGKKEKQIERERRKVKRIGKSGKGRRGGKREKKWMVEGEKKWRSVQRN